MKRHELRLARPLYEGLPWFYVLTGVFALVFSYRAGSGIVSVIVGVLGLVCVLGGVVVWLRRRDFRALRANYTDPDSSVLRPPPEE